MDFIDKTMKNIILLSVLVLLSATLSAQEKEVTAVIETNAGNIKIKLYNDTPKHRDNFVRLVKSGHYDGTLFYRVVKGFVIQGGSAASRGAAKGQPIAYGKPMNIEAEIRPNRYHKKGALAAPRQPNHENFLKESDISQFYIVQGRKYSPEELELIEKKVNNPIRNAIQRKCYTKEKKAVLDSLRQLKKVDEFREIAQKIKDDIAFEWAANPDKIDMPEDKKTAYTTLGGLHHLDKEYTVFGEVTDGLSIVDKIAAIPINSEERPLEDVVILRVRILN